MGTINKQIADAIMNEGKYNDEVRYVVTYNNMFDGGLTYATVGFRDDPLRYHQSPACQNVKVIWTHPARNPCLNCMYKFIPDGGYCYMFKHEPFGKCAQFKEPRNV